MVPRELRQPDGRAPVTARGKANPRYSNGSRRRAIRARWKSIGAPCHLCGKPIDYGLPAGHPMSFEVDEIVPVSKGGDPLDFANTAPSHRLCNQRKGDGTRRRAEPNDPCGLPTSREW